MVLQTLLGERDRLDYQIRKLDRLFEACRAGDLDDLVAPEDLFAELLGRARELGVAPPPLPASG
ncbi:MAG: hypothetical protein FJX68_10880 [Alphaproteobacteria bacterium]|nr:hypothetical protein [Alphaproteobacteria bacterium]